MVTNLKNNLIIRTPVISDAANILEYLRIIGGETDYLTFGTEGHPNTIEQEAEYITTINEENNKIMLLALLGEEIIAVGSLSGSIRPRLKHTLELGISVKQAYWHQGVATSLLEALIHKARTYKHVQQITLHVVTKNTHALHLYEKFGFVRQGVFPNQIHAGNQYFDSVFMVLPLNS